MVEFTPKSEHPSTPFDMAFKFASAIHERDPQAKVSRVGEYSLSQMPDDGGEVIVQFSTGKEASHAFFVMHVDVDGTRTPIRSMHIMSAGIVGVNSAVRALTHMMIDQELGWEEREDLTGERRLYKSDRRKRIEEKVAKEIDAEEIEDEKLGFNTTSNRDVLVAIRNFRDLLGNNWPTSIAIPDKLDVKGPPTDDTTDLFKQTIELLAKGKSMKSEWSEEDVDYTLETKDDSKNPAYVHLTRKNRTKGEDEIEIEEIEIWEFSNGAPVQYYTKQHVPITSQILLSGDPEKLELAISIGTESRRNVRIKKEEGSTEATTDEIARGLEYLKSKAAA